jgi:hypothetical protein
MNKVKMPPDGGTLFTFINPIADELLSSRAHVLFGFT